MEPRQDLVRPGDLIADPLRLRQIRVNLVNNALKLTERGEVVLSVEAGAPRAVAVPLRLSVRDTGIVSRAGNDL